MTDPHFPTEKEFLEWWNDKMDFGLGESFDDIRAQICPIARYLRARGCPEALVAITLWSPVKDPGSGQIHRLPNWAIAFVEKSDHDPGHRGLPKGYAPTEGEP